MCDANAAQEGLLLLGHAEVLLVRLPQPLLGHLPPLVVVLDLLVVCGLKPPAQLGIQAALPNRRLLIVSQSLFGALQGLPELVDLPLRQRQSVFLFNRGESRDGKPLRLRFCDLYFTLEVLLQVRLFLLGFDGGSRALLPLVFAALEALLVLIGLLLRLFKADAHLLHTCIELLLSLCVAHKAKHCGGNENNENCKDNVLETIAIAIDLPKDDGERDLVNDCVAVLLIRDANVLQKCALVQCVERKLLPINAASTKRIDILRHLELVGEPVGDSVDIPSSHFAGIPCTLQLRHRDEVIVVLLVCVKVVEVVLAANHLDTVLFHMQLPRQKLL
eukprot:Opistho-2@5619